MVARIEEGSSYDLARTRKANADAQLVELNLAQARGELCATAAVVKAWESVLLAFRTRIEAIPTKIAPILAAEDDPAIIKERLEAAIKEALDELANYRPDVDPEKATVLSEIQELPTMEPPKKRRRGRPSKLDKAKEAAKGK